ncbi:cyclin-dependent protein kinase inhibitor SMR14-like [Prosopis cineraria]|nr:cyclin-dependent protein kinase inhibitor SMR14-like [Prosopis cineraria]
MEFNLLVRPTVDFLDQMEQQSASTREDGELCLDHPVQGTHREGDNDRDRPLNIVSAANLNLNIRSYNSEAQRDLDESSRGCKTPTSSDHKIPSSLRCPPAPKKPRSIPSGKRKSSGAGNFLDLSREIESLFPAPLLLDLYGKIKKVRRGNGTQ